VQELSTKIQVEWRRRQVFELSSKGLSQVEIARKVQIHESTISRDIDYLKEQSKDAVKLTSILLH
jgi:DNA-binding NarL/FixJ family response regulator